MFTDFSTRAVSVFSTVSTAADARTTRRRVEARVDAREGIMEEEEAREEIGEVGLRPEKVGRRAAARGGFSWWGSERVRMAWERVSEEEAAMANCREERGVMIFMGFSFSQIF